MDITSTAIKIAKKAGKLIAKKQEKDLNIEFKAKHDLVTNADKASEKLIIKEIKKNFPDHGILGEEDSFGKSIEKQKDFGDSEYIWIVDPIDGTTNYAHGLPHYCVSIGVFKTGSTKKSKNFKYLTGEMVSGVIYSPGHDELFYAEKGKGAFLNRKRIRVSKTAKLTDSLLVTGFPPAHKEINLPYFSEMIFHCQAVRRYGSAALDLAYVAAGRFDAFWEFGLKPWDIAAGILILEEAGGTVTDTNGQIIDLFGQDILASNKKTHQEILKIFKKIN